MFIKNINYLTGKYFNFIHSGGHVWIKTLHDDNLFTFPLLVTSNDSC